MRGVLHAIFVPISFIAGLALFAVAPTNEARIFGGAFAVSVLAMFAASANLHRRTWSDLGWWRARQLDMTAIYVIIAGSYTVFAGLGLSGGWRTALLATVWIATLVGITIRWLPIVPPFGLTTSLYILCGAMFLPAVPKLWTSIGSTATTMIIVGCLLYLVGGLLLGARVPNPIPDVFGYHEVWHVFVTVAVTIHYCAVAFVIFPNL